MKTDVVPVVNFIPGRVQKAFASFLEIHRMKAMGEAICLYMKCLPDFPSRSFAYISQWRLNTIYKV